MPWSPKQMMGPETEELANPRETERQELFDRLERRADTVRQWRSQLSDLGVETSVESFDAVVHDLWSAARESSSEDSQRVLGRVETLDQQRAALQRKISADQPPDQLTKRRLLGICLQEWRALEEDDGARFLWNLEQAADHWKQKHRRLYDQQYRPELRKELSINGQVLDPKRIVETRLDSIHAAFILDKEYYDQIIGTDSAGTHFLGTPWSFIRQGEPAGMDITLRHEAIHNALDGALDIQFQPKENLSQRFGEMRHLRDHLPPEDRSLGLQKMIQRLDTNALLDGFQHELLAGLEQAENGAFSKVTPDDAGSTKWIDNFVLYTMNYSTAGSDAWGVYRQFEDLLNTNPALSTEVTEQIRSQQLRFAQRFTETVETMRTSIDRARQLGPEVFERVHDLFVVVPPSKYRHISRYLDSLEDAPAPTG